MTGNPPPCRFRANEHALDALDKRLDMILGFVDRCTATFGRTHALFGPCAVLDKSLARVPVSQSLGQNSPALEAGRDPMLDAAPSDSSGSSSDSSSSSSGEAEGDGVASSESPEDAAAGDSSSSEAADDDGMTAKMAAMALDEAEEGSDGAAEAPSLASTSTLPGVNVDPL